MIYKVITCWLLMCGISFANFADLGNYYHTPDVNHKRQSARKVANFYFQYAPRPYLYTHPYCLPYYRPVYPPYWNFGFQLGVQPKHNYIRPLYNLNMRRGHHGPRHRGRNRQ